MNPRLVLVLATTVCFLGQVRSVTAQACSQPKSTAMTGTPSTETTGTNLRAREPRPMDAAGSGTPAGQPFLSGPNSADRIWMLEVADESRSVQADRTPDPEATAEGKTRAVGPQAQRPHYSETSDKTRGHLQVRTSRVFPQPNLLNALSIEDQFNYPHSVATRRINTALRSPIRVQMTFTEHPLRDVVAQIKDTCDIPVRVDMKALEDAGFNLESPITKDISGVSLRSALRLLLGDLDLTYLVHDEVLLITTKERAGERLLLHGYAIPRWSAGDAMALVDLVQNTVGGPGAWADGGGNGSIVLMPHINRMVIAQTQEVHEEIADLLESCDDLALPAYKELGPAGSTPTRIYRVADESLHADLQKKLASICNEALGDEGDPDAKVTALGDRLVVQSRCRAFHVYAAEVIYAINGEDRTVVQALEQTDRGVSGPDAPGLGMGGMGGGGMFSIPRESDH